MEVEKTDDGAAEARVDGFSEGGWTDWHLLGWVQSTKGRCLLGCYKRGGGRYSGILGFHDLKGS